MTDENVDGFPVEHHALRVSGRVEVRADEAEQLRYGRRVVVVIDGVVEGIGFNDRKGETVKVGIVKPNDCLITSGDWREALIHRMGGVADEPVLHDGDSTGLIDEAIPDAFGADDSRITDDPPAGVDGETGEIAEPEVPLAPLRGEVVGRVSPAADVNPGAVAERPGVGETETLAVVGVGDPVLKRFMEVDGA